MILLCGGNFKLNFKYVGIWAISFSAAITTKWKKLGKTNLLVSVRVSFSTEKVELDENPSLLVFR